MTPFYLFKVYGNEIVYDRYSNEFLIINNEMAANLKNKISDDYNLKCLRNEYHILKNFTFPGFSLSKTDSIPEKIKILYSYALL